MAGSDKSGKDKSGSSDRGRVGYVDAGGHVHSTPDRAIAGSLAFEQASGTGAGCGQSPDNVSSSSDSKSDK